MLEQIRLVDLLDREPRLVIHVYPRVDRGEPAGPGDLGEE